MLDSDLAALLWVRSPVIAADLPREQLMAAVYAGMQPGAHLWTKYLQEISTLQAQGTVNQDDAVLLRARPEARAALMQVTLGEADDVDQESVEEVLRRVHNDLAHPIRVELDAAQGERDAARARSDEALRAQAESDSERARAVSEAAEREDAIRLENTQLQQRLADLEATTAARHEQQRAAAESRAHKQVYVTAGGLGLVLVALAIVKAFAPSWLTHLPAWVTLLAAGAVILVAAVAGVRHFLGGSVREWLGPVEKRLVRRRLAKQGVPTEPGGTDVSTR